MLHGKRISTLRQLMKQTHEKEVSARQVLFTILIWIVLSVLAGMGTYYAIRSWAPGWATVDNQSITIVAEVYFLFLLSAFIVFGGFKGFTAQLNFRFTGTGDIWLVIKLYGITLGVTILIYFLLSPFIGPLPRTLFQILRHASDMSRLPSAGFLAWFLIIIRACILAPLTEELLFRGLLFGWLRGRFSAALTIFVTALLFTVMHYYPILFPLAFLFGAVSGWVRERTGSSLNFVIAHILNSILFLATVYIFITFFKVSAV
jgi:membrane protease YdiL (CAAX protease family)